MHVVCPSCAAAYEVPEALLGHGARRLRCARCAREWTVEHPAQAPSASAPGQKGGADARPPIDATPLPPGPRPPPLSPTPSASQSLSPLPSPLRVSPRRDELVRTTSRYEEPEIPGRPWLGWVAALLALAVLCLGAYVWRGQIMAWWPQSVRIYAALGLA